MKYIIVALLTLFFSFPVFSQELTVKSFEPAPMDLTASTSSVKDLNGKACGLVKVLLAAEGAKFEGNVIGNVAHNTSQYYVYMTDGSYKLAVSCPGYLPLMINFRDYGIQKVESNHTYILTLFISGGNLASSSKESNSQTTTPSHSKVPVPEAVDLGLSVKWASFNLGASKPEGFGNYYKWGETEPADKKGKATYSYSYDKTIYRDKMLKPEHDAATVNLGGKWRMPTHDEMKELKKNCTCVWTTLNGINGIRVTGPNGNSIFLPASGYRYGKSGSLNEVGSYGYCWTSSPSSGYTGYGLIFDSETRVLGACIRARAFPVRPVLAE